MKQFLSRFEKIIRYFFYSVLSTIVDVLIVWILQHWFHLHLVVANTIGVVSGFIISYILSSKSVFDTELGTAGFLIYFGTFLVGLIVADLLISGTYQLIRPYTPEWFAFLFSKGVSIVVPFFALYFSRKYLYALLRKKRGQS